ncbi:MAG: hypothetical protein NVSMB46_01480 [Candidatus Saccharimonadales bacterium]
MSIQEFETLQPRPLTVSELSKLYREKSNNPDAGLMNNLSLLNELEHEYRKIGDSVIRITKAPTTIE